MSFLLAFGAAYAFMSLIVKYTHNNEIDLDTVILGVLFIIALVLHLS